MKKNSLLIIIAVTIVALSVIIAVIIASVANSGEVESGGSQIIISGSDFHDNSDDDPPNSEAVSVTSSSEPVSTVPSDGAKGIVETANSLIGVPFVDNGADSNGFDNSGFIYYVLRENGYITCPRTTDDQTEMGPKIEYSQLKAGDLAFFSEDGGAVFGGIYIGGGNMIGCLMPGQTVKIIDITNDYYKSNFYHGISLS